MTRVLVVTAQPPAVEGGAAGRCMTAMLRGLAGRGLQVHTVAPHQDFTIASPVPDDLSVEVVAVGSNEKGGPASWPGRLRRPLSALLDASFADLVRARAEAVDVVHLDQVETACLLEALPDGIPTVVHLHYRARLDADLGVPWRPEFRRRLEFVLAERVATRRAGWLVANSREVAATLSRPHHPATVVPLALDPRDYPAADSAIGERDQPPRVGIVGTAAWGPTAAAMQRLVHRVWPLVHRRVPDAELVIAGRGSQASAADFTGDRVRVVGEVISASEFLRSLSVLAYPPGRGSGTKVKVLEALMSGVPVVATPPGAEGIEPNAGLLVADEDEQLADHVVRLLRDVGERQERGQAGRDYMLRRHAPGPATAPLVALYERMLA